MTTGVKLAIGAAVISGTMAYMAFVGASASWKYYVTADECLANRAQFAGQRVRISGSIVPGSLQVSPQRQQAQFSLQGQNGCLHVVCQGPLPDNLNEAREVVVEGRCAADGSVQGDKVLTRCASKYQAEPPEAGASEPPTSGVATGRPAGLAADKEIQVRTARTPGSDRR